MTTDSNHRPRNNDFNEADSKADAVALFFIVLIMVCTAVYFANQ